LKVIEAIVDIIKAFVNRRKPCICILPEVVNPLIQSFLTHFQTD